MTAIIEGCRYRAFPIVLVTGLHVLAWLAVTRPHFIEMATPQRPIEVRMLKAVSPPPVTAHPTPTPSFTAVKPEIEVTTPIVTVMAEPANATPAPILNPATSSTASVETHKDALLNIDESELRYLQIPEVRRPTASRRVGEHGIVHLWLYIDAQGRVVEVRVNRSSSFKRLDEAALKAMMQARFLPYTKNGKAYPVTAVVPVEFPA